MGEPVNIGFVGAGFVGQVAHLIHYARNTNCRLVALCEARPELRESARKYYGFEKTYSDLPSFLNDPEINAVVCITRRQNTGPLALEILSADKHLLTEKPICHSVAQGELLVSEAEKHKRISAVGYMRRHDQGVQDGKKILDEVRASGELGKLNYVRVHCYGGDSYCGIQPAVTTQEVYPSGFAEWNLAPSEIPENLVGAYASFTNVFCHNINLLRYLISETPEVSYVNLSNASGGLVVFDYENFRATLEAGHSASNAWDDLIELFFDLGIIRIVLQPAFLQGAAAKVEKYNFRTDQAPVLVSMHKSNAFQRQADAFVKSVSDKTIASSITSSAEALEDIRWIEKIWQMEIKRRNE